MWSEDYRVVITVDGKLEKGMKETASDLKISEKTLRKYLLDGKLPVPESTRQGTRKLRYFTDDYIERAKKIIAGQ